MFSYLCLINMIFPFGVVFTSVVFWHEHVCSIRATFVGLILANLKLCETNHVYVIILKNYGKSV